MLGINVYAKGGTTVSSDRLYRALKSGKRKSYKYASVEMRGGGVYHRRNANQYGKVKGGNTYYEYSENRSDSQPRKYLAKGGNLGLHYVIFDGTSAFVCDEQDMLNITTKDKDCKVVFKSVNLEKASDFADNYNDKTLLAKGGNIEKIAQSIFDANEMKGKIKTNFGDKTIQGLNNMIENDSYTPNEIAISIFNQNEKNGKIATTYGNKTIKGLTEMIEDSRRK
jgi:hypothetical protein